MHFNTQIVYLLGTESLTGAVIASAVLLILAFIHIYCCGFSRRQEFGWVGILAFVFPIWYTVRWIMEICLPSHLYGAITDSISIFYGETTERSATIILVIWGGGVLCGIIYLIVKQLRLRRTIKEAVRVTNPEILYTLEELQESLGICRDITVLYHSKLPSPGCAGIWKPYIVMNEGAMDRENIYSVLCHELIHIKKNDILFRFILDIVSVIHWFNPIVHIFRLVMTRQIEYGCDTYAILHTGWCVCSGDYIASISRVIKKREKNTGYVLAFGGKHENTKSRTRYLKKVKSPKLAASMGVMVLSCAIFFGASFTAYAANKTFTQSYETWIQTGTEAVCEGEGEKIRVIEEEYSGSETLTAEERNTTIEDGWVGICWKLNGGETLISQAFEGSAGEIYSAMMMGQELSDYDVGLIQPDGEIIWIHLEEDGYHEFVLKQNGGYRLAVKNNQDKELQIDISMRSSDSRKENSFIEIEEK